MGFGAFVPVLLAVGALVGVAFAAMSIGAMFRRPCLRGSCGGAAVHSADGEPLSCADCPNRRRPVTPPESST
jgi:hypothetical protein